MNKRIFFSWQADTPPRIGRNFLRDVLEEACKKIGSDTNIEESIPDLSIDSDTSGVPGQPPIADTIYDKIDDASVFVADLTFVSKRDDGDRLVPNPNVLLECGRALKSLGYKRVIYVMNSAYGDPAKEGMPFNLQHVRRPTTYFLTEESTVEEKRVEKERLIGLLEKYIKGCLKTIPDPVPEPLQIFPEKEHKDGFARFRSKGEGIGIEESFRFSGARRKVFLSEGPSMWLRIMPKSETGRKWKVPELKDLLRTNNSLISPLFTASMGYSFLRAGDGVGTYTVLQKSPEEKSESLNADSIAFIFETGELWSIDVGLFSLEPAHLLYEEMEVSFIKGLHDYSTFLDKIGVPGPYIWKAGLIGVMNRTLVYQIQSGQPPVGSEAVCVSDMIMEEGQFNIEENPLSTLLPFLEKIFDDCGIRRPSYYGKW
jgi:hypothetical protein